MKARNHSKSKLKNPTISKAQFARSIGITKQALAHHEKSPDAPKIGDTPGWIEFLAVHERAGSAPSDIRRKLGRARLRLMEAQGERIERENAIASGALVTRTEVLEGIRESAGVFWGALNHLLTFELPPQLQGLDALAIRDRLTVAMDEVKLQVRGAFLRFAGENFEETKEFARGQRVVAEVAEGEAKH